MLSYFKTSYFQTLSAHCGVCGLCVGTRKDNSLKYVQPKPNEKVFTCFKCGAISEHNWYWINFENQSYRLDLSPIRHSTCVHCGGNTIWHWDTLVYPQIGKAPLPNNEMPDVVKQTYLEAASIHLLSPRGAAALLRLSIQILCKELGEKGKNINDDIASLVKKGLPEVVQQSLDIVRVTGNNSVHPGQIDVDNTAECEKLFELINIIVEYMIALPKKVGGIYSSLPSGSIDAIKKRDGNT